MEQVVRKLLEDKINKFYVKKTWSSCEKFEQIKKNKKKKSSIVQTMKGKSTWSFHSVYACAVGCLGNVK